MLIISFNWLQFWIVVTILMYEVSMAYKFLVIVYAKMYTCQGVISDRPMGHPRHPSFQVTPRVNKICNIRSYIVSGGVPLEYEENLIQ